MKLTYKIEVDVPGLGSTHGDFVSEEIRLAIEESLPETVENEEGREYQIDVLHVTQDD